MNQKEAIAALGELPNLRTIRGADLGSPRVIVKPDGEPESSTRAKIIAHMKIEKRVRKKVTLVTQPDFIGIDTDGHDANVEAVVLAEILRTLVGAKRNAAQPIGPIRWQRSGKGSIIGFDLVSAPAQAAKAPKTSAAPASTEKAKVAS
jgi:hypothetical protein